MLLAIDIGNTNINNGIFKGKVLKKSFIIPSRTKDFKAGYAAKLKPYTKSIRAAVIVSVAPQVLNKVKAALREIMDGKIFVVGSNLDSGVKNRYRIPRQVGQDRLVNARAAYELYGGASIIVDFGTAITVDVVTKRKEYIGGIIAPGVELSLRALWEHTALLPKVELKKPRSLLGRDTQESMRSGAFYGFAGLCDSVVKDLKKRYCRDGRVVATGGMSRLIGPYCEYIDKIDPRLTLKGLRLIGADIDV